MYKVDVEESSGERTSRDLMSHTSLSTGKKGISPIFLANCSTFCAVVKHLAQDCCHDFSWNLQQYNQKCCNPGPKEIALRNREDAGQPGFHRLRGLAPLNFS